MMLKNGLETLSNVCSAVLVVQLQPNVRQELADLVLAWCSRPGDMT